MISRAALSLRLVAARPPATPLRFAARGMVSFPNDNQILGDDEQMAGRRKVELDDEKKGLVSGLRGTL